MQQGWFVAINQVINNISVLAIFLCGAAVLREREHGNIEHLLVMPLRPFELMFAKIWANGLVVIIAAMLSLFLVVKGLIGVPDRRLDPAVRCSASRSTSSRSPRSASCSRQLSVRCRNSACSPFPVFIVMSLLSGGQTPLESMPVFLQKVMQFVPSTHFVSFSQAVLFRNATLAMVWPQLLAMFAIGSAYTVFTLVRFRKMLAAIQ